MRQSIRRAVLLKSVMFPVLECRCSSDPVESHAAQWQKQKELLVKYVQVRPHPASVLQCGYDFPLQRVPKLGYIVLPRCIA